MTAEYQAGVPPHCPPPGSENKAATLCRVCAKSPPDAEDYTSHAQSASKRKKAMTKSAMARDPNDCRPSGLSVWLSEKAMRHACKVFPFTEGKFVFKTAVTADEGKLQLTGENEHHTYWAVASTDLRARAKLAFGPVDRSTVDVA